MRSMKSLLVSFTVCSALAGGVTLAQTAPAPTPTPTPAPAAAPTTPHAVPPHTPPATTTPQPRAPLPGSTTMPPAPGTLPVPGSATRVPQQSPRQGEELQQQQNLHNQVNDNANSSMQRNGKPTTQRTDPMINPAPSSTTH